MTAIPTPTPPQPPAPTVPAARPIPSRLLDPLRIVASRARTLTFFRAAFKFIVLAAITWLVSILILGSRTQIPAALAIPLLIIAWAIVLIGAIRLFRPVFRRQNLTAAARMVDLALPDTQERISSALELTLENNPAFRGSPELVACLIRQAEHHADCMNPTAVVSGRDVFRWFTGVIALFLVWFILLVLMTPNFLLGLRRTFAPWSAAAPLATPILDVSPGDAILAQGQSLDIKVTVKPPHGLSLDTGLQKITSATLHQHFTDKSAGLPIPDRDIALVPIDDRSFHLAFDGTQQPLPQQSFTYQITIDGGKEIGQAQSELYTISMQARPGIASMQLAYTFPAYTQLPPRTEPSPDGIIDTLVGTKVRLTIKTTQAVKTAQLSIDDNGTGTANIPLLPTPGEAAAANSSAPLSLTAEFTLAKSSQYHITLLNAEGRDNPDSQPHPITARPDSPPHIAIAGPSSPLTIRPDDTVPIHFTAGDDFGLSKIEALIQVDDLPLITHPLQLPPLSAQPGEGVNFEADWPLALPELLNSPSIIAAAAGREPKRIAYQLKVTDNRTADYGGPQSALSQQQLLNLDKNTAPLAQRLDNQAAQSLASAMTDAAGHLKSAETALDSVKKDNADPTLSAKDQQQLVEAQKEIAAAQDQLTQAADQAQDSRLNDLARQLRDTAQPPLRRAQDEIVKSQLARDQADARNQSVQSARDNVQQAIDALNQNAGNLKDAAKNQPLAQALESLAQKERQLADALSQNPNDPKLLQEQKDLQKQLDQLIKDNPELQKPAAQAHQAQVDELVQKLQQLEQAQQPLADPLANQTTTSADDQLKELARRQDALNKEITRFSQQRSTPLNQAAAKPPQPNTLDPIVKSLQADQLSQAAQDQKAAASQLDQTATKLDGMQKKNDDTAGTREKASDQAAQAARDAADLQNQTRQLAKDIQENKTKLDRPSEPANQKAEQLADEIKKQAQQLAQNQNPAAKAQAQAAAKSAEAVNNSVRQGNGDTAQQQLAQAANQLTQAAQAAQNAAGPAPSNNNSQQNTPGQAAAEAQALADKQRDLANQTDQLAQSKEDAKTARANAPGTAAKQQALSDQLAQAAKDAQSIQQQTQGSAPELSQRAAQAAQSLQKSSQAQKDAAQATRDLNAPAAAARQSQSAEALAAAEESLTGQHHSQAQNQKPNPSQSNPSSPATPQSAQSSSPSTPPSAQSQSAQAPNNQTSAQSPSQNSQPPSGQNSQSSPGQSSQSASAQNYSNNQSPSQSPNQSSSQSTAQSPSPSQGQSPSQSQSQNSSQNSAQNSAQSPSQNPGNASAQNSSGQSPSQSPNPSPGQSPIPMQGPVASGASSPANSGTPSPTQSAAQSVQSARNSASQATNGNAAAARQTADQLAQASRQLMPTPPNNPGNNPSSPSNPNNPSNSPGASASNPPGGNPSDNPAGSPGGTPSGPRGSASGSSGTGEQPVNTPASTDIPKAVQEVGISPSEWAKLPPKLQEELLHSAQQSGPPAYRDMIKNYYSRIAHLPAENEAAQ